MPSSACLRAPTVGDVIALSQAMIQSARANDWDAVQLLQQQREGGIQSLFAKIEPDDREILAQAMQQVLDYDRVLVTLTEEYRADLSRHQ